MGYQQNVESAIAASYPGVTIRWDGDNPTLVIPDELIAQAADIAASVQALYKYRGGKVEFDV
jgi:hypothetical protein